MRKIILREDAVRKIVGEILSEEIGGWSDMVLTVKKFLDGKYVRPRGKDYVVEVDSDKQVVKPLTDKQLFYVLQDEFRDIIADKGERDRFLIQVIKDWYNDTISKYGSLTAY